VELERVINRALQKDRNLRYPDASDIRGELQRLKRHRESSAAAVPASPDKSLKRGTLWVVVAGFIVAIGLAATGTWYLRSRTAQIDSIAVLPFTNGGRDTNTDYLGDGITESLIGSQNTRSSSNSRKKNTSRWPRRMPATLKNSKWNSATLSKLSNSNRSTLNSSRMCRRINSRTRVHRLRRAILQRKNTKPMVAVE
jgi:hypothetical protein